MNRDEMSTPLRFMVASKFRRTTLPRRSQKHCSSMFMLIAPLEPVALIQCV
jgi:hypothetical protein